MLTAHLQQKVTLSLRYNHIKYIVYNRFAQRPFLFVSIVIRLILITKFITMHIKLYYSNSRVTQVTQKMKGQLQLSESFRAQNEWLMGLQLHYPSTSQHLQFQDQI